LQTKAVQQNEAHFDAPYYSFVGFRDNKIKGNLLVYHLITRQPLH